MHNYAVTTPSPNGMFPYWERLVCLLLARSLSHPSPRTPHSEVLNLGIIPLHQNSRAQKYQSPLRPSFRNEVFRIMPNLLLSVVLSGKFVYIFDRIVQ